MNETVLELVLERLSKLEEKVDVLLSFRSWLLGVGATISAVVSLVVAWFTTK